MQDQQHLHSLSQPAEGAYATESSLQPALHEHQTNQADLHAEPDYGQANSQHMLHTSQHPAHEQYHHPQVSGMYDQQTGQPIMSHMEEPKQDLMALPFPQPSLSTYGQPMDPQHPGHMDAQHPGDINAQHPSHIVPQHPGHMEPQHPIHMDPQHTGHMESQHPGHIESASSLGQHHGSCSGSEFPSNSPDGNLSPGDGSRKYASRHLVTSVGAHMHPAPKWLCPECHACDEYWHLQITILHPMPVKFLPVLYVHRHRRLRAF